jgi:hypothetical protein
MKYLSRSPQISVQSHSEIVPPLKKIAAVFSGEGLRVVNKEIEYGHLVNGLILLMLDGSEEDQLALAREVIARLEDWMLERESKSGGLRTRGLPGVQLPKVKSTDNVPRRS